MAVDLTLLRKQVQKRNEGYRALAGELLVTAADDRDSRHRAALAIETLLVEQEHAHAVIEQMLAASREPLALSKDTLAKMKALADA